MKKVLILGATSAIAQHTAKLLAKEGAHLFLVGRNKEKLEHLIESLKKEGAPEIGSYCVDLDKTDIHKEVIDQALAHLKTIDIAFIAHGTLGVHEELVKEYRKTEALFKTNLLSPLSLLIQLASYFEKQRKGHILVITSIAGDRGRPKNYTYGASKAALSTYLSGLRARLHKKGVHVMTIKPGPVFTPMTEHLFDSKSFYVARPEDVAKDIIKALHAKKDISYTPSFWKPIMYLIRLIPEKFFKRIKW